MVDLDWIRWGSGGCSWSGTVSVFVCVCVGRRMSGGVKVLQASWPSLRPGVRVDEVCRTLEKRIWMTTVCRGYKRTIKRGRMEGTRRVRGLGKHLYRLCIPHSLFLFSFVRPHSNRLPLLCYTTLIYHRLMLQTSFTRVCTLYFSLRMPKTMSVYHF